MEILGGLFLFELLYYKECFMKHLYFVVEIVRLLKLLVLLPFRLANGSKKQLYREIKKQIVVLGLL